VAGCRAALCPLHTEHITLGTAHSDTAAVTSCMAESVREVVNCELRQIE